MNNRKLDQIIESKVKSVLKNKLNEIRTSKEEITLTYDLLNDAHLYLNKAQREIAMRFGFENPVLKQISGIDQQIQALLNS